MKKTIFALALGTFGLGMAEFGIMGVLPELAHDVGLSIPAAGNMISWYAVGVVIGAPVIALCSSRFSLKTVMVFLAILCILGNVIFTFSSSYLMLSLSRLISGFPHGAVFGVGTIILSKIAPPGKVTAAVAGMIAGMTIANLIGVPLGTWIGHQFSWRYTFFMISLFDVAVLFAVLAWVPNIFDKANIRLREQFHFLGKPEPWLIFSATIFGNAGIFAWFSYIKPFMIHVSGFNEQVMMFIMMLAGLGMVLGNIISGRFAGRYSPLRIAILTECIIVAALLLIFVFGEFKVASLILAFICCAGLFALAAPLQILLLQSSKGGEMLGAAGGQMAFNLGNAMGAFFGGLMVTLNLGWSTVTLPSAVLAFLAMLSLISFGRYQQRRAMA